MIQLNLVRSINTILDVLSTEMGKTGAHPTSPMSSPFARPVTSPASTNSSHESSPTNEASTPSPVQFSNTHALLKLRLAPLRRVEADLKQLIGAASDEVPETPGIGLWGNGSGSHAHPPDDENAAAPFEAGSVGRRRPSEYYVRSNATWREAVLSAYHRINGHETEGRVSNGSDGSKLDDATEIIASCADDMQALWEDDVVRDVLRRRKIRMELAPG